MFQNTTSTKPHGVWPRPFWKNHIDRSSNYQNFLCWGAHYASEQELASVAHLNSVSHRNISTSGFTKPLAANFLNGQKHFPWQPCKHSCRRCKNLQGGWRWNWVGSRTADACHVDDRPSQEELHERLSLPWPHGLLKVPSHDAQALTANLKESPPRS